MLFVPVRFDQQLVIDGNIKIQFERKINADGNPAKQVAFFIDAPDDVVIVREEVAQRLKEREAVD